MDAIPPDFTEPTDAEFIARVCGDGRRDESVHRHEHAAGRECRRRVFADARGGRRHRALRVVAERGRAASRDHAQQRRRAERDGDGGGHGEFHRASERQFRDTEDSAKALAIAVGETSKTITISLLPNAAPAGTKTFSVQLSNPNGATISGGTGAGTLLAFVSLTPWQRWQSEKFTPTELADATISGPLADRESEGMPNILKYALGTPPNARATAPSTGFSGGRLTLTFMRNTSASDTTLTVQAADSPVGLWVDLARSADGAPTIPLAANVAVDESGTGTTCTVVITDAFITGDLAHPQRFMRLQASLP